MHSACTAFERVETKTEKVAFFFREEVGFLSSLAFIVRWCGHTIAIYRKCFLERFSLYLLVVANIFISKIVQAKMFFLMCARCSHRYVTTSLVRRKDMLDTFMWGELD